MIFEISSSATGSTATSDRDRHAALAGRAEASVDRRVGGEVEVGVGQHDHVVLRPPEGLDALARGVPVLVDVAGDRRRADEGDGLDVGVLEEAVDRHLVAVHDVEHAFGAGRPRPSARRTSRGAEGSFSLGFTTTVLPQAMAIGKNQHGTMAGKLKGLMIPTTPRGWRIE